MNATESLLARTDGGLDQVRRDLVSAHLEKVARVVAMVDALPRRGQADALIAPLRGRLATLHLPRPLTLSRLLFVPLEPVLVHGAHWRRGAPGVPRTTLGSFAGAVRAALGAEAVTFDARLAGHTVAERALVGAEGALLWPRAATILLAAPAPPDWQDATGLGAADHAALARTVAYVLDQAAALRALVDSPAAAGAPGPDGPSWPGLVETALARPQAADPTALATVVAVMLAEAPRPEAVLEALQQHETEARSGAVQGARDLGVGFALQRLHAPAAICADLAAACAEVDRHATLLDELTQWAAQRPSQRGRIDEARRAFDLTCRDRFTQTTRQLTAPPEGGPGGVALTAEVCAMEQTARDLRRFERAARRVGGAGFYDGALRDTAEQFREAGRGRLTRIDRVRMVELLAGPESAMRLLLAQPADA